MFYKSIFKLILKNLKLMSRYYSDFEHFIIELIREMKIKTYQLHLLVIAYLISY